MHPYVKAVSGRLAEVLDWLHRRWPLVGLLVLLLLVVLSVKYQEFLASALRFIGDHFGEAARAPVGALGLLFVAMIFALVIMAFIDTSPTVRALGRVLTRRKATDGVEARDIHALTSRVKELEGQVKVEVALRDQWYEKYTFGRELMAMRPVDPHDRAFMLSLAGDVEEDFRKAIKAAQAVIGEMNTIAHEEENVAVSSLIEQLGDVQWGRLSECLRHLRWRLNPENREPDRDPRPYLLMSYMLYAGWWTRFPTVARAIGRPLERLESYPAWYQAHTGFQARFWGAAKKDQLGSLGAPAEIFNNESGVPVLAPPLADGGAPN